MRLVGVAWKGFALPFRRPFVTSHTRATSRYGLLLFLRADSGLTGVGEASPVGVGSRRQVEDLSAEIGNLAARLLGKKVTAPDNWRRLPATPLYSAVRFGLETALLDVLGKFRGYSMAQLLGRRPTPLAVNALISAETPEEAVAEAKEAISQGFTSLKLKVALGTVEQDEKLVSAVRRAVGPRVRLRIDPNQAWSVPQAIAAIGRLARYDLEYVEQPVPAADLRGLAEVRHAVSVPIAADEAFGSIADLRRLVKAGAADLFILKAARLGIAGAMEAISIVEKMGKPLVVTSSLESGVGIAASAQLAATLPSQPFAHGLATGLLLESDLLSAPLLPVRGMLSVPQGPGLGISLNEEALDRYVIGVGGSIGSW